MPVPFKRILLLMLVLTCCRVVSGADLTVIAENVRNAKGVVGVLVFRSNKGWPEDVGSSVQHKAVPARDGAVTLVFQGLEPATYAVVVLHDENENMKLDRSWIGKPKEGWGMSNNPKPHLSAPPFESARFTIGGPTELKIHLRY